MDAAAETGKASIPLLSGLMPDFAFPGSALLYFQFVFAAITPIILGGAVVGRMSHKAWMIFVPVWSLLVYSVNAFMLWGGDWLAQMGAVDFSGGYVIHVAAGVSGFVAAAVVGPRLIADQEDFKPNNLPLALVGAGLLWLGWNGFNGGDPYFANQDAAAAVLNTNIATAAALLTWFFLDMGINKRLSFIGAINGMIAGLVAITPAAGYVNGFGAVIIGVLGSAIPWAAMNKLSDKWPFKKVDDTLGVIYTHAMAGAVGGLLVGVLADPSIVEYLGATAKTAPVSVAGLLYGNPHQLLVQFIALIVVAAYDALMTFLILKAIALFVPLRMSKTELLAGDRIIFNEEVFELHHPIPEPEPVETLLSRSLDLTENEAQP